MSAQFFMDAMNEINVKYVQEMITYQRPAKRKAKHIWLGSCVAACLVLVVALTGGMSVKAYREKVIEIITRVYQEFTYFEYFTYTEPEYTSVPEVEFTYVPEGFNLVENSNQGKRAYILYEYNDEFFEFSQYLILPGAVSGGLLDTEDAATESFYIGDSEVIGNSKGGNQSIYWSYGNVRYELYGNIEMDELRKIAFGIVTKDE